MWCGVRRAPLLAPVHNQHYSRQRGGVQLFGTSVTLSKTQNEKKVILKNKSRTFQIRKKKNTILSRACGQGGRQLFGTYFTLQKTRKTGKKYYQNRIIKGILKDYYERANRKSNIFTSSVEADVTSWTPNLPCREHNKREASLEGM